MSFDYYFLNQTLSLLPQKAILWKDRGALIIADVHLGKTSHFRKSGIAVPNKMQETDINLLTDLIDQTNAKEIIFLGDLFHSVKNKEWDLFAEWRLKHMSVEIHLVKGNHDIIPEKFYEDIHITIHPEELISEPFVFLHEPVDEEEIVDPEYYYISGHIHPGFLLTGKGKQNITLSCFCFGERQAILPAFGTFTGKMRMDKKETDKIFCISGKEVIAL